jgi:tRNA nucleotidyltransferase/poly(A) polymerase
MDTDPLREGAREVARVIVRAGFQAYFAGGCVRDLLLGTTPKDYDVATDATPDEIQRLFRRTVAVGASFGVVRVAWSGDRTYEVATFRADGAYADGRRPTVVHYTKRVEDDVERRDFTINAMVMEPETGVVHDHVGGRADLEARRIRAVGDPTRRFAEDRLRMLRAVRFAARLGFTIDPPTLDAIRAHAPELRDVSVERIVHELHASWTTGRAAAAHALLVDTTLLAPTFAGIDASRLAEPSYSAALARLDAAAEAHALPPDARASLGWAATLHAAGHGPDKAAERALTAFKLSRDTIRTALDHLRAAPTLLETGPAAEAARRRLLAAPDARATRAWVDVLTPPEHAARAARVASDAALAARALPGRPLLRGEALMRLGVPAGPALKGWLEAIDDAVLLGSLDTAEAGEGWVRARLAAGLGPRDAG